MGERVGLKDMIEAVERCEKDALTYAYGRAEQHDQEGFLEADKLACRLLASKEMLRRLDPDDPANVERVRRAVLDVPGPNALTPTEARAILAAIAGADNG